MEILHTKKPIEFSIYKTFSFFFFPSTFCFLSISQSKGIKKIQNLPSRPLLLHQQLRSFRVLFVVVFLADRHPSLIRLENRNHRYLVGWTGNCFGHNCFVHSSFFNFSFFDTLFFSGTNLLNDFGTQASGKCGWRLGLIL